MKKLINIVHIFIDFISGRTRHTINREIFESIFFAKVLFFFTFNVLLCKFYKQYEFSDLVSKYAKNQIFSTSKVVESHNYSYNSHKNDEFRQTRVFRRKFSFLNESMTFNTKIISGISKFRGRRKKLNNHLTNFVVKIWKTHLQVYTA